MVTIRSNGLNEYFQEFEKLESVNVKVGVLIEKMDRLKDDITDAEHWQSAVERCTTCEQRWLTIKERMNSIEIAMTNAIASKQVYIVVFIWISDYPFFLAYRSVKCRL
jgi:uncharacterized protein YdcH (DUF465 family)